MNEQALHPILRSPHEYDLIDFRFHVDQIDPSRSFVEMTLTKPTDTVALRFWQPQGLTIEEGFPQATRGMVFYDLSAHGLEDIGVEVSDFEASRGSIKFFAKGVEKLTEPTN